MKKNAFTLVEVLCVIAIISILMIITIPVVTNNLKSSKDKIYDASIKKIITAAVDWSSENTEFLPLENEEITITLGTLQSGGYISTDLKNAKSDMLFPADMTITIKYVKSSKDNRKEKYGKYDGNYLFKVNVDSGTNIEDIKDDYTIIQLNSKDEIVDEEIYKDKEENQLSLKDVNIQIIHNNINVATIDTSMPGIYYVYYSYKNNKDSFIRVFNVTDTELPEIIFPKDDIVSVSVNSFDLYSNVKCTDNSKNCNLKIIEGEEDFYNALSNKVKGNYVISYRSSDAVGNSVVKKRVIEIVD